MLRHDVYRHSGHHHDHFSGYSRPHLLVLRFSGADFTPAPQVMHGGFDLIGRHTRSAIGIAELHGSMPIEVEALCEVPE